MKKSLLILLSLVICASASAFSSREHAAIAVIADKYLSPKTRKAINEITGGEKIVALASYPDRFRDVYLYNGEKLSHGVTFKSSSKPSTNISKSALGAIDKAMKALGEGNYKNCPADSALIYLSWIVHFAGDMHCPSHMKYPKEMVPFKIKEYVIGKKSQKFHSAWDGGFASIAYVGGPLDVAYLADIATSAQRRQIQQGTPVDWAMDNLNVCAPCVFDVQPDENGVIVADMAYVFKHAACAKTQVMKAGYRLAELLNRTFD